MPTDLAEWVEYIQTLHAREIDLTLERVEEVYARMYPDGIEFSVIVVAGTNGKGSTAELIASIYRSSGYLVGKYTSPHISAFNERYNIAGDDIDDQPLLDAFGRVEQARMDTPLTFFEFGTLIAIELFAALQVDVAILEVGLGGRLDATNILDCDAAVITSISIDHTAWLGDTIEQIALEKIAVARSARPCVVGMQNPPKAILDYCRRHSIQPDIYGNQFSGKIVSGDDKWSWRSLHRSYDDLELPFGQAGHQLKNASSAIQVVVALEQTLPITSTAIVKGIADAHLQARCQLVASDPTIVLDVAHNVDSVARLAEFVRGLEVAGKVYAICGMLKDKQIAEALSQLVDVVDEWHFATINNERGATAREINDLLNEYLPVSASNDGGGKSLQSSRYETAVEAFQTVRGGAEKVDCLIVFGSFFIVSDIIRLV